MTTGLTYSFNSYYKHVKSTNYASTSLNNVHIFTLRPNSLYDTINFVRIFQPIFSYK